MAALPLFYALLVGCVDELSGDLDAGASDGGEGRERDTGIDAAPSVDTDSGLDAALGLDAAPDGGHLANDDAAADATREELCKAQAQRIAAFVESHRECASDEDCAIVGDCSHSNFQAVSRSAEAEARDLVLSDPCGWADGPGYYARCRQEACERVKSTVWCGSPQRSDCPLGTSYKQPGCNLSSGMLPSGCYASCSGQGEDGPCTTGFTCQKANVHPCPASPSGGDACAACNAEQWLCLPAAACQLELALTFDGRQAGSVRGDEASVMQLVLKNRTDEALTFSFEQPCHGPILAGLEAYDAWDACLAGACPTPTSRVELTLAPREVRVWRKALIEPAPSQCNMQGLAAGTYTPTFALPSIQGANLCGPGASSLSVTK